MSSSTPASAGSWSRFPGKQLLSHAFSSRLAHLPRSRLEQPVKTKSSPLPDLVGDSCSVTVSRRPTGRAVSESPREGSRPGTCHVRRRAASCHGHQRVRRDGDDSARRTGGGLGIPQRPSWQRIVYCGAVIGAHSWGGRGLRQPRGTPGVGGVLERLSFWPCLRYVGSAFADLNRVNTEGG